MILISFLSCNEQELNVTVSEKKQKAGSMVMCGYAAWGTISRFIMTLHGV